MSSGSDIQGWPLNALGAMASGRIFKLVLTGGPCGGKSTVLSHLSDAFEARSFDVYCAPEVPSLLINGGCAYPGHDGGQKLIEFEMALIKLQIQLEDSFVQVALSTGRPSVVVFDRGLMDISAYLPKDQWQHVLAAGGYNEVDLAARYDLVLHLVTAAEGAESYYTTANNTARSETLAQACDLDASVRAAWTRTHQKVRLIDNSTGFPEKVERCIAAVNAALDSSSAAHEQIPPIPKGAAEEGLPPLAP